MKVIPGERVVLSVGLLVDVEKLVEASVENPSGVEIKDQPATLPTQRFVNS